MSEGPERVPLSRDRVLRGAVDLADEIGSEALSMRRLAQALGVVPMALYKHVANKEELLDGMVEVIVREIDPPIENADWQTAVRMRVLAARRTFQSHAWSRRVVETRTSPTTAVFEYLDSMIKLLLAGGFSPNLAHHVMHAFGGRVWGFTQELFDGSASGAAEPPPELPPQARLAMLEQLGEHYPNITTIAMAANHESESVVGHGCDDQFEFEFALDVLLDGFERLKAQGWNSADARAAATRTARADLA